MDDDMNETIEGLQRLYECHPHQHQKMYMSWCHSINGKQYYECLYCKRILIDEEIDLEKIQKMQFKLLQSRIARQEKIIKEAKRALKMIYEDYAVGITVETVYRNHASIAKEFMEKIEELEKDK